MVKKIVSRCGLFANDHTSFYGDAFILPLPKSRFLVIGLDTTVIFSLQYFMYGIFFHFVFYRTFYSIIPHWKKFCQEDATEFDVMIIEFVDRKRIVKCQHVRTTIQIVHHIANRHGCDGKIAWKCYFQKNTVVQIVSGKYRVWRWFSLTNRSAADDLHLFFNIFFLFTSNARVRVNQPWCL